jgi:hypothetical protein
VALQIAPLIVAERRILISLYLFMAGIILFHLLPSIWHSGEYLNWFLSGSLLVSITGLGAAIYARHSAGHDRGGYLYWSRSPLVLLWQACNVPNMISSEPNMALPLISKET